MRRTVKGSLKDPFHSVILLIAEDSDGRKDKDVKGSERDQLAIRAILSSEHRVIQRGLSRAMPLSMTDLILALANVSF